MLKPFLEMREVDVSAFLQTREGKDEKGRKIDVPFLPWEGCLVLLYLNGAKDVSYRSLTDEHGSPLFCGERHKNDKDREGACYFVHVEVTIDDKTYTLHAPVMNGTAVVYNDTLNQLRVSNAIQRAFVKCVAVNTGLGIKLWEKGAEFIDGAGEPEEVTFSTPLICKEEIEKLFTKKLHTGMSKQDVFALLKINQKTYDMICKGLDGASWLISQLGRL